MQIQNLSLQEILALAAFGVVALIVAAVALKVLVRLSRVVFTIGCLLLLALVAVAGSFVWRLVVR